MRWLLVVLGALGSLPHAPGGAGGALDPSSDGLPDLVLCDVRHGVLIGLGDRDKDGRFGAEELRVLWTDGGVPGGSCPPPAPACPSASPRAVAARVEHGSPVLYWTDTAADALYRGIDHDGDGCLETFETGLFRDVAELDGPASPGGLEPRSDGSLWWCSEGAAVGAAGLFRLVDSNGDGDANDAGERSVLVAGRGPAVHVESRSAASGLARVDAGALLRLCATRAGVVAYCAGASQALFRFEDRSGDGDVQDAGEVGLFLNATGHDPELEQSPDFASGALPALVLANPLFPQFSAVPDHHARLAHLGARREGEVLAFYLASDAPGPGGLCVNAAGESVRGLVFRAVDRNADGDVNDAGEVRLFFDGSDGAHGPPPVDRVVGLAVAPQGIFVADRAFGVPTVHRLVDRNGDGDALDEGEQDIGLVDPAAWLGHPELPLGAPDVVDLACISHQAPAAGPQLPASAALGSVGRPRRPVQGRLRRPRSPALQPPALATPRSTPGERCRLAFLPTAPSGARRASPSPPRRGPRTGGPQAFTASGRSGAAGRASPPAGEARRSVPSHPCGPCSRSMPCSPASLPWRPPTCSSRSSSARLRPAPRSSSTSPGSPTTRS